MTGRERYHAADLELQMLGPGPRESVLAVPEFFNAETDEFHKPIHQIDMRVIPLVERTVVSKRNQRPVHSSPLNHGRNIFVG